MLMEDSTTYFRSIMAGYFEEFPDAIGAPPTTGSGYKDAFIRFCLEEMACMVSSGGLIQVNCTDCSQYVLRRMERRVDIPGFVEAFKEGCAAELRILSEDFNPPN
jgi:hypothetical protein